MSGIEELNKNKAGRMQQIDAVARVEWEGRNEGFVVIYWQLAVQGDNWWKSTQLLLGWNAVKQDSDYCING